MSTTPIKVNKGEWSELYTLLKLLADQKLYAGDENLKKLEDIFFPILKIYTAKGTVKESAFELDDSEDIKVISVNSATFVSIKRASIRDRLTRIFNCIKAANVSTFEIPLAEELLEELGHPEIKGYSNKKSDIVLKIHDINTGYNPEVGFSIKSRVGGASTLLNAGDATNFIYEIENLSINPEEVNLIETHSKVRDRLSKIYDSGASLKFVKVESAIFEENLMKIDFLLPSLIAQMLIIYYSGTASTLPSINTELENSSFTLIPNHIPHGGFYEFKLKHFLMNTALGMTPATRWDGLLEVHGGYIVVREDGEIVCYHIYNQDAFRDYLFKNTRLETASTSRHGFAKIYLENRKTYIKLNLQVRFIT
ncbi:MAG: HpaII family restriction endonuclease [bacterium]